MLTFNVPVGCLSLILEPHPTIDTTAIKSMSCGWLISQVTGRGYNSNKYKTFWEYVYFNRNNLCMND